jgi:dipeptidyl aminopeptidase/acylaminoacyl peptidase
MALYELTDNRVDGPNEAIPVLLFHRQDLPGPKPGLVYYHGVVQNKEQYVDTHPLARRLADAGYVVAIPDAPGHGARAAGATLIERLRASLAREFCRDIELGADESGALLDWFSAQPSVDQGRLGVLGISMGGYTTAVVAARQSARLRAAVCIAGGADLTTCMRETDSIAPGRWGPQDRAIDEETRERIARIDPLGYADRYAPLPLLLLHGERDTWNPVSTARRFHAALEPHYKDAPESLKLVVVPEAPHWPPGKPFVDETLAWLARGMQRPEHGTTVSGSG